MQLPKEEYQLGKMQIPNKWKTSILIFLQILLGKPKRKLELKDPME